MPKKRKPSLPRVISFLIFLTIIIFFIATASSAELGSDFNYRENTYGWPNKFLTIIYEKATIVNIQMDNENLLKNIGLIFLGVAAIRLLLYSLRVKTNFEREQEQQEKLKKLEEKRKKTK
ncbi:MAG: hypothetical protein ACOVNY_13615 [Chitinophagaceae bacterium]|jgi:hypothetical protein